MACLLKIEKATYKLSWNGQKQIAKQFSLHLKIIMIICILAVRKVYKSSLFADNLIDLVDTPALVVGREVTIMHDNSHIPGLLSHLT